MLDTMQWSGPLLGPCQGFWNVSFLSVPESFVPAGHHLLQPEVHLPAAGESARLQCFLRGLSWSVRGTGWLLQKKAK